MRPTQFSNPTTVSQFAPGVFIPLLQEKLTGSLVAFVGMGGGNSFLAPLSILNQLFKNKFPRQTVDGVTTIPPLEVGPPRHKAAGCAPCPSPEFVFPIPRRRAIQSQKALSLCARQLAVVVAKLPTLFL